MHPAIRLDLGFDLAGPPASIAQSKNGSVRTLPFADGAQDVERGGERYIRRDWQRRVLAFVFSTVEDEAAARLDGTSEENGRIRGAIGDRQLQAAKEFLKPKPLDRFVDDDAHRAGPRMRAHIDHAALEAWIGHTGQGDKQLAFEKIVAADGLRMFLVRHIATISRCFRHGSRQAVWVFPEGQLG